MSSTLFENSQMENWELKAMADNDRMCENSKVLSYQMLILYK